MKALGILLIGGTIFLGGCACNCDEKVREAVAAYADSTANAVGSYNQGETGNSDNSGDAASSGNGSGTGSTSSGNGSGSGSGSNDGGATMHYEKNNTGGNVKTSSDPREYDEQSTGGVGYRTDSIKSYKGVDGTARDKTTNNTNKPK
jgi:hypothetical protein